MSKISTLTLKKGQYLSNLSLPVQKNKFTLIQAGTGVGKTTTIMEDYPKQHPIIVMLVPSVLKVKELETTYGDVSGSIQYRFYYDKKVRLKMNSVNRMDLLSLQLTTKWKQL